MTRFFKFKYLPVFAMVFAGGLAVAMKDVKNTSPECRPALVTYYVDQVDGGDYVLRATPHPNCGDGEDVACEISSTAAPANNRIPVDSASVIDYRPE